MSVHDRTESDRLLRSGLANHMKPGDQWMVFGQKVRRSELLAILDERLRLAEATVRARFAYRAAVKAQRAHERQTRERLSEVRQFLRTVFSPEKLAAFGVPPRKKRRKLTVAEKLAASLKLRATRRAKKAR
jgi:hypothetical protein